MSRVRLLSVVLMLVPAVLLGALAMDIYLPSVPHMPELLHASREQIQWTLSIYMGAYGLGHLVYGPLADALGRKIVLMYSLLLYALASCICLMANSVDVLIAARLMQGLAACGGSVVVHAILRDTLSTSEQPRAFSYMGGMIGFAPIIAPAIGATLLLIFGSWRASFALLTIFAGICFISYSLRLKETLQDAHRQPLQWNVMRQYWQVLKNPAFCMYSIITATGMSCLFLFFSMSSIIYVDLLQVSEQQFSLYFAMNAGTIMLANFIGPEILHRLGEVKTIALGLICILIAGLMMTWIERYWGLSVWALLLPMCIASFGLGLNLGPAVAGALHQFPDKAGVASALMGTIRFVIPAGIGAWVMHYPVTSTNHLAMSFLILSLMTLFAFLYFAKKRQRKLLHQV